MCADYLSLKKIITNIMKVVTAVVNNPIFIEIQYYTFKKHIPCEFEFIVFNDAKDFPDNTNYHDITMRKQIEDMCKKLGIKCINIPNDNHKESTWASARTADAMNFITKYQIENPDEYFLFDSDMFLIDTLDIERYREYQIAVLIQHRPGYLRYFWNGIYYFNIPKMKNLDILAWDMCDNCDTGGRTGLWLWHHLEETKEGIPVNIEFNKRYSKHIYYIHRLETGFWNADDAPECIKKNTKLLEFLETDPRNENGKFFFDLFDYCALHYRAGGNWRNEGFDFHKNMSLKLKNIIVLADEERIQK